MERDPSIPWSLRVRNFVDMKDVCLNEGRCRMKGEEVSGDGWVLRRNRKGSGAGAQCVPRLDLTQPLSLRRPHQHRLYKIQTNLNGTGTCHAVHTDECHVFSRDLHLRSVADSAQHPYDRSMTSTSCSATTSKCTECLDLGTVALAGRYTSTDCQ